MECAVYLHHSKNTACTEMANKLLVGWVSSKADSGQGFVQLVYLGGDLRKHWQGSREVRKRIVKEQGNYPSGQLSSLPWALLEDHLKSCLPQTGRKLGC